MKPSFKADTIRVKHMLDAIKDIRDFSKNKSFEDFKKDKMFALASLKSLEIIGEAASKVSDKFRQNNSQVPWQEIIGIRNRLVHGYYDFNEEIVWQTIVKDIPELKIFLKEALKS